jgi:hypothetical protein
MRASADLRKSVYLGISRNDNHWRGLVPLMLRSAISMFTRVVRRWSGAYGREAVMAWTAPYEIECARMRLLRSQTREPSVNQIIRIGMDRSKHFFQRHGVNAAEQPVLRRKLRRKKMLAFFAKLPPTVIGMEACGASHYWARELQKLGHEVKLIAPQHVKALHQAEQE